MKSSMSINVEFLAGTTIEQAVLEAKDKAEKLDVAYICFKFNGRKISIGRECNLDDALDQWGDGNSYIVCA